MSTSRDVDRAIANIQRELAREPEHKERDWFTRVKSISLESNRHHDQQDWSGAKWSGSWVRGNWHGGREM